MPGRPVVVPIRKNYLLCSAGSLFRSDRGNHVAADINPLAGKPAVPSMLANIPRLVTAYFAGQPDPKVPSQRVAFGTSGHRGSALNNAFNEAHILAISQALCDHRRTGGITGPM